MKLSILSALFLTLNPIINGQGVSSPKTDRAEDLISQVLRQAEADNERLYREYQYSFKFINTDEKTSRRKTESFEFYCRADGRSGCQVILIGREGKMISPKKLQKAREKASAVLAAGAPQISRQTDYGYGTTFGYAKKGQNFWVDQALYLKLCELTEATETIFNNRKTLQVDFASCKTEGHVWQEWIGFMPQTRARLWLDEEDRAVAKMEVYPAAQVSEKPEKPVITIEFFRMNDGTWLHQAGRLSTKNKSIFPLGIDDFEIEYFDYRKLNVEVEAKEIKSH